MDKTLLVAANLPDLGQGALEATLVEHGAGADIPLHAHAAGQLSLVISGTLSLSDKRGWWLAPPGRGIWVPPGVEHTACYAKASVHIKILFSPELSKSFPAHCHALAVSSFLHALACEALSPPHGEGDEKGDLMAKLIVIEATKPRHDVGLFVPQGRDPRLVRVINRLLANPSIDETLEDLSGVAMSSARTLSRLFVSETGMTFGRWREHLRVVKAVDHLVRGESITQTAISLGFGTASSFTTMFTRIMGTPPARYLKDFEKPRRPDAENPADRPTRRS
ncbi:helix-turn-helix domain-containing protein [Rhizobium leguminosarum]|jgi:AraC-like DNA-binding protein/quercetin dioxygenase-like cupin family protein|nr:helix-turn-helix domain-containing protein [Rhizobium leguminosarum]